MEKEENGTFRVCKKATNPAPFHPVLSSEELIIMQFFLKIEIFVDFIMEL